MLHDRSDVKDARGQTKIRNQRATLRRLSVESDVMRKALQAIADGDGDAQVIAQQTLDRIKK